MITKGQVLLEIAGHCDRIRIKPMQSVSIIAKLQELLPDWGADFGNDLPDLLLDNNSDDMAALLQSAEDRR